MLLEGKVVVVTGGGRGLGAAISRVLARNGAVVAVNYAQSADMAAAVVAEIEAGGRNRAGVRRRRARRRGRAGHDSGRSCALWARGRHHQQCHRRQAERQRSRRPQAEDYTTAFDFGCTGGGQHDKSDAVRYMKDAGRRADCQHRNRVVEHGSFGLDGVHGRQGGDGGAVAFACV